MSRTVHQPEGLRARIAPAPPLFWFGAISLLLHLLLVWAIPSPSFQISDGPLPLHVEFLGQAASSSMMQPVSSSPDKQAQIKPPLVKPVTRARPQQTAKQANRPVSRQLPSVQQKHSAPKPAAPIRSAQLSASADSIPPGKQAQTILASTSQKTQSERNIRPMAQRDNRDSIIETDAQPAAEQPSRATLVMAGPDAPAHPAGSSPNMDSTAEADTARRVKLYIRQALAEHFVYPFLARKRGWQGEVLLSFDVDSDGRISHARIIRSSGYRALDQAALKSLARVGRIEQAPLVRVSLQLPVAYQLES